MEKTTQFISIILLFASFLLTSCSSDDDKTDFGVSTGNYLPLAINNVWNYNSSEQNSLNEIKIIETTTISGYNYFEFSDDSDIYNIQHWFGKKGATYLMKTGDTTVNESGINITIKSYELPILKDDYEINKTWTGRVSPKVTYSGNGQSGSLPFKVDYTGRNFYKGEVTLNDVVYPNVIKTRLSVVINANEQVTNGIEEYWFAENIGIIKIVTYNSDGSITEKDIFNYLLN